MRRRRAETARAMAEARRARERAEQQLAAVRGRWPHVTAWAQDLRRIREANHLAPLIEEAFRG